MHALPPAAPLGTSAPRFTPPVQAQPVHPTSTTSAPAVVQQVTVTQTPARSDLLTDTQDWTWAELRDYVVAQIIERFGPFPRDARKEYGIFTRFFNEYGQDGIAVAKFAFGPVCDGWWASAPISINRFCKGSDPYFVKPILERLAEAAPVSQAQ